MTEAEQHATMGKVVAELAAHRRELACLQSKAERFRKQMVGAATVLDGCVDAPDKSEDPTTPSREPWPTYDEIVAVFDGCQSARQRIKQLEDRLREWGAIR